MKKTIQYFNYNKNLFDDKNNTYNYSIKKDSCFYQNYMMAIREYKILDIETEKRYFNIYKKTKSKEIKEKIILHNLTLVMSIAKHFLNKGLEYDELVQEGNIGLIEAIDSFDESKGNKFSTYAYYLIKAAITNAIAEQSRTIKIPYHRISDFKKIENIFDDLTFNNGYYPSYEQVASKTGYTTKKFNNILNSPRPTISLNINVKREEQIALEECITDEKDPFEEKVVDNLYIKELMKIIEETLTEKECYVIYQRYGVNDNQPKTLKEIGRTLGLTSERVRQIEKAAKEKIKEKLSLTFSDIREAKIRKI